MFHIDFSNLVRTVKKLGDSLRGVEVGVTAITKDHRGAGWSPKKSQGGDGQGRLSMYYERSKENFELL